MADSNGQLNPGQFRVNPNMQQHGGIRPPMQPMQPGGYSQPMTPQMGANPGPMRPGLSQPMAVNPGAQRPQGPWGMPQQQPMQPMQQRQPLQMQNRGPYGK